MSGPCMANRAGRGNGTAQPARSRPAATPASSDSMPSTSSGTRQTTGNPP